MADEFDPVPGEIPAVPARPDIRTFRRFVIQKLDDQPLTVEIGSTVTPDDGSVPFEDTKAFTIGQLKTVMDAVQAGSFAALKTVVQDRI